MSHSKETLSTEKQSYKYRKKKLARDLAKSIKRYYAFDKTTITSTFAHKTIRKP